jgi:hypothetical protein
MWAAVSTAVVVEEWTERMVLAYHTLSKELWTIPSSVPLIITIV